MNHWILIFSALLLAVDCKRFSNQRHSKVIATFSEDDISSKLPSPESVAAQIPKNLILKSISQKPESSHDAAKIDKKPPSKVNGVSRNGSRKKIRRDAHSVPFDRKSKSMNNDTDNDLDYEGDEHPENFVVVDVTAGPSLTASITQSTGVPIPTASLVSVNQIQIARIYGTTKEKEQEQESPTIPSKRVRKFNSNNRMNQIRANSSSAENQIRLHCNSFLVLVFTTIAILVALI